MSLVRITLSHGGLAGLFGAGLVIFAPVAMAQTQIGSAAVVQNDVRGHTGGEIFRIARGDNVFLDEFVQTSSNSKAKIVFLDTTNMSVGPDSVVKLDQFIYNGNGTAKSVSINATKGAFRFFSGSSEHRAYKVTTPQAVIGVRGTTYDVLIANGQTYIKLQEGAVTACVRTGTTCRDIDRPGDYLIVNDNSIDGPYPASNTNWDFGSNCTGAAADLCNKTRFAANTPPPPPPAGNRAPAPRNTVTPPPPGPQLPPPVRVTSLPPSDGGYQPPVYVPPPGPHRPPVVQVDPPVYVPPVRVPPVYDPPRRPPHTTPPRPNPPPRPTPPPKVEGKPYPGTQTTPTITRNVGTRGIPPRWVQGPRIMNPNRVSQMPRMQQAPRGQFSPRMTMGPGMGPRMNFGPRINMGPRMGNASAGPRSAAPRMASISRNAGGFGGGRRR